MSLAAEMLRLTPSSFDFDTAKLADCIEACFDCLQVCIACADACLGESDALDLRLCITRNLSCADVCAATGRTLSRQFDRDPVLQRTILEACRLACGQCAEECERHADHHEHCRVCAEACRRCESACGVLLDA